MKSSQVAGDNMATFAVTRVIEVTSAVPETPDGTPAADADETELSFEIAMRELEEIVNTLERGSIPLERQIALVRRGMELAEQCDHTLTHAEATLEQLVATPDGELITQRVAYDADEDAAADE